jgi:hypothetical protein
MFIDYDAFNFGLLVAGTSVGVGLVLGWIAKILNLS